MKFSVLILIVLQYPFNFTTKKWEGGIKKLVQTFYWVKNKNYELSMNILSEYIYYYLLYSEISIFNYN
jgi:hypothetical protein